MVCLGNICRSPLAEGIMQKKINTLGLDWEVDSAGTGNYHIGDKPDPRSIEKAREYGLNIEHQRARQFTREDFKKFDKILAMDTDNYTNIIALAESEADKLKVELIRNLSHPKQNLSVPDPYWDDDSFEEVYQMLDIACDSMIKII